MAARDFILYPLAGALAGVVLAAVITRAPVPVPEFDGATGVFLLAAAVVGGAAYFALTRKKAPPKPKKAKAAPRTAPPVAPAHPSIPAAIRFPQIETGYPDVWAAGVPFDVVVDAPNESAVALAAGSRGIGAVRATGSPVLFPITIAEKGTVSFEATVSQGGSRSTVRRTVRFVRYDEEIQGLFSTFRDWAEEAYPDTKNALTARELIYSLRTKLGPSAGDALSDATRVFELVAYGGRDADRKLYLAVVDALAAVAEAAEKSGKVTPSV